MYVIGKLGDSDRLGWEVLFRGYNSFYERSEPQSTYEEAWARFRQDSRVHCLVARSGGDGALVGLAHFLQHASTTSSDVLYLQDLYTAPIARGTGVATALISAVVQEAQARGCARVYWTTRRSNTTARQLYDRLAQDDNFMLYRIALET